MALAGMLAAEQGAQVTLAGVMPSILFGASGTVTGAQTDNEEEEGFARRLTELAAKHGAGTQLARSSSPARGLYDVATELEADLVVLGSSERAGPGRSRAGRVAMQLLQGGHAAVALAPVHFAGDPRIESIGVALDGSPAAETATRAAVEYCRRFSARPRLISVAAIVWSASWAFAPDAMTDDIESSAQAIVDKAMETVPDELAPEGVVLFGDPPTELIEHARDNVDLLCLGSRGYGPLRRVLLGSVSSVVVRDAPCATLIVPSDSE